MFFHMEKQRITICPPLFLHKYSYRYTCSLRRASSARSSSPWEAQFSIYSVNIRGLLAIEIARTSCVCDCDTVHSRDSFRMSKL